MIAKGDRPHLANFITSHYVTLACPTIPSVGIKRQASCNSWGDWFREHCICKWHLAMTQWMKTSLDTIEAWRSGREHQSLLFSFEQLAVDLPQHSWVILGTGVFPETKKEWTCSVLMSHDSHQAVHLSHPVLLLEALFCYMQQNLKCIKSQKYCTKRPFPKMYVYLRFVLTKNEEDKDIKIRKF